MNLRALGKIASALYPNLPAKLHAHSMNQLCNTNTFKANEEALERSLDAFPDGVALHMVSGSAFYCITAMGNGTLKRHNIKTVCLDSIPFARSEARLMRTAGVPKLLCAPLAIIARSILHLDMFGATDAYTDHYFGLLDDFRTFGTASRVLVACSTDDFITPIDDATQYAARVGGKWAETNAAAAATKTPTMTMYEGKGPHACMTKDDPINFVPFVHSWMKGSGLE